MAKEKEKRIQATVSKQYTNTELDQLYKEIERFREPKTVVNIKTGKEEVINPINWMRFYSSKGVVQIYTSFKSKWDPKKGEICGKTDEPFMIMAIIKDELNLGGEIPYLEVENMVNQCMERQGRREYGEKKRLIELEREALATSMHIENEND